MMPATTEGEKVRFHTLDRATGHHVASRYIDAVTGKPVDENDEVKGYERGDNDFVVLEDDELRPSRWKAPEPSISRLSSGRIRSTGSGSTDRITSSPMTPSANRRSRSSAMRWRKPRP
jgi:hypothetical protein